MRFFVAILAPALAATSPIGLSDNASGDVPSPDQIQIVSTSNSGNGCPQGTVTTDISPDRTVSCLFHIKICFWIVRLADLLNVN